MDGWTCLKTQNPTHPWQLMYDKVLSKRGKLLCEATQKMGKNKNKYIIYHTHPSQLKPPSEQKSYAYLHLEILL